MKRLKSSIHNKTIGIIALGVTAMVLAVYFASRLTVMGGFLKLEKTFLERNIDRSQGVIADRVNNLAIKLSDWSSWDDTCKFIDDKNEAYIKSNIVESSLENLKINYMVYINASGEIVYTFGYDGEKKKKVPVPEGFLKSLTKGSLLASHANEQSSVSGIILTTDGPLLVASKPILTSESKGPVKGALIFAADLDSDEIARLGNILRLDMDVKGFKAAGLPEDFVVARRSFLDGRQKVLAEFGKDKVAGYSVLKDIYGKSALILKISEPREIYQFGSRTLNYFVLVLLLVGLLFGAAVFFPLEQEIIARKWTEKLLREIGEKYQTLIETTNTGYLILDSQGKVVDANKEYLRLIGRKSLSDVLGKSVTDWTAPYDLKRNADAIKECMAKGFIRNLTIDYLAPDGKITPVEIQATVVKTEGDFQIVSLCRDITIRKMAQEAIHKAKEEAEASAKAKSSFLSNMSHEIRTPMNAILGFGELLKSTPGLTDKQKGYVEMINSSGQGLVKIIDDILDISKMEAGRIVFETVEFDLHYLSVNVFKMIAVRLKGSNVHPYVEIAQDVPILVKGDPTRLRQILVNLLGNAAKFTKKGGVGLIVELGENSKTPADEIAIRFIVKDTGIGIPKDKIEEIFLPFTQADSSTTRKFGGTGLGLTIVKSFIQAMGGQINVRSEEGQGTEFIVDLTFKKVVSQDSAKEKLLKREEFIGKKVLILDDNEIARRVLNKNCQLVGLETLAIESTAEGAQETLDRLAREGKIPDVLLFDVLLEHGDSLGLLKNVKADGRFNQCKIIAVTAEAKIGDRETARNLGFDGYLPKPFVAADLVQVLSAVLAERKVAEAALIPDADTARVKILLVEDSIENVELMLENFKILGCDCTCAYNGIQAIQELQTNPYDICFMDIHMPEMNGLEATTIIKHQTNIKIPIIALTAAVLPEEKDGALQAGMDAFLTKPVQLETLREIIKKYALKFKQS
ncbi:MAG: response regulator [Candidatus Omnitrophica bacterium]|nr:response regulator [Candidatus Omnitrophota bacterium]